MAILVRIYKEVFFMQKNTNWTARMLAEGAICIALAFVLGLIKPFSMPQGGSVTAGEMIPIIIFAMRYGPAKGIAVGVLYGFLDMIIGGSIYHPVQALLDYPIAYGALGLAGIFAKDFQANKTLAPILKGSLLGVLVRMICHVLSGVIFFAEYTPEGMNPWIYSITYNGSFLLVEIAVTILIIYLLRDFLTRQLPSLGRV